MRPSHFFLLPSHAHTTLDCIRFLLHRQRRSKKKRFNGAEQVDVEG